MVYITGKTTFIIFSGNLGEAVMLSHQSKGGFGFEVHDRIYAMLKSK